MMRDVTFNSINLDSESFNPSNQTNITNGDVDSTISSQVLPGPSNNTLKKSFTLDANANIIPRISTPKLKHREVGAESKGTEETPKIFVFDCDNQPVKLSDNQATTSAIANQTTEPTEKEDDIVNKYLPKSKFGLGSDHADILVLGIRYFRIVFMVYVVWLLGYLGFSASWILIAVFVYLYREKLIKDRLVKSKMVKALGINEKKTIMARIDEVPSWVYFPDKDRAEWLNKIIKQVWPFFIQYLTRIMFDTIEPMINQYSPAFIDKIQIKEIDLGDTPPRIGSVKVYSDHVPNDEIILDVELLYAGDAQIKLKANKVLAGIKDIQFQGDFRVILKPLCNISPFFAAIKLYLLKLPEFDFNLTDAANMLDIPGLRRLIDITITDVISKTLVLPNRIVIPIIPDFDLTEVESYQTFRPRGILRIEIKSASNLKNADFGPFGKSDPYVKITGIGIPIQTKVIRNNLNPVWNETYHIMIDEIDLEPKLLVEVYDKDEINDDFLGGLTFRVDDFVYKRVEENNYKLKNVKQGHLRMKFEWFYLSTRREKLSEIRRMQQQNSNATCVLLVTLKSASDLPNLKKYVGGISEPNPRVLLEINNKRVVSSVKPRTTNPKWNENHYFFLENPEIDKLVCSIEDEPTKTVIANMSFSLGELLKEEELQIDRYFDLNSKQMGYNPKLSMRLALKIFTPNKDETCNGRITPTVHRGDTDDSDLDNSDNELLNAPKVTSLNVPGDSSISRNTSNLSRNLSVGSLSVGKMQERDEYGKIRITTKYNLAENAFVLTVHECRNLKLINHSDLPNPFLKSMLIPDRKTRKKTKSLRETANPLFNERIQWKISHADLKKRKLLIKVKNDKSFHLLDQSFLGQIILDLSNFDIDSSQSSWFDLRSRDDSAIMNDRIEK